MTAGERHRAKPRTPRRPAAGRSRTQARRAAAVARVRQGAQRVAVAEQYGISLRTLERWLAAAA
nr:helix-turn-helix domain-containing protein [Pseudonocardia parietis]